VLLKNLVLKKTKTTVMFAQANIVTK